MFKIQLVNAFTQEVLREKVFPDLKRISEIISTFEESQKIDEDFYLFDEGMNVYKARYISYQVIRDEEYKVYRLFFKAKFFKKLHLKQKS
ncbi:hypothetical protein ACWE42_24865 [Sutcliffiella cohnii]